MPKPTLQSLPGEIRNAIWRLVVHSPTPINVEPLCQPNKPKLHQPAAAFTSRAFRTEILGIFYAENTFYLGKIGYHDSDDIRLYDFNVRLKRWREMLGAYSKFLSRLSMAIDGRCYAWNDGVILGDARFEMEVLPESGGRVRFEMNGRERCTCRLRNGVVERATRDGRVLLDVMQEYSASYCEAVREGRCQKCGCTRLERLGCAAVARQDHWESIVPC